MLFSCVCHKKIRVCLVRQTLVRIKGLEPPRLSASDPKSDVATNYTISAGSCFEGHQPVSFSGAKISNFYNIRKIFAIFL